MTIMRHKNVPLSTLSFTVKTDSCCNLLFIHNFIRKLGDLKYSVRIAKIVSNPE